MKKLFSFLVIILAIISCNKKNENDQPYVFDTYRPSFMNYYTMGGVLGDTNKVVLEYYSDGKIKRRMGDMISVPIPPYPLPYQYCDCVIDTFSYSQDQVQVIRRQQFEDYAVQASTITYFLENGRVSKITSIFPFGYYYVDTTLVIYNDNGLLDSTVTRSYHLNDLRQLLIKVFSFDTDGNLVKIVGEYMGNGRIEENFSGYDQHDNPLKNVIGLEDVFYRSLSKNNFTDYSYKEWWGDFHYIEKHWDLKYDDNDRPLFY
jgi:hypothetical protein